MSRRDDAARQTPPIKAVAAITTLGVCAAAAAQTCRPHWSAEFAAGPDSAVAAIEHTADRLYVGGGFQSAAGVPAARIAAYEAGAWSALGPGFTLGNLCQFQPVSVRSLLEVDLPGAAGLIAGGPIGDAGGVPTEGIARWDGSLWHTMDDGLPLRGAIDDCADVRDMVVFDDGSGPALYAAGYFDVPSAGVARWNGAAWEPAGGHIGLIVDALHAHDDGTGEALYAAGLLQLPNGTRVRLARWDGQAWSRAGVEPLLVFEALAEFDEGPRKVLLAAGSGNNVGEVLRWDGQEWTRLGEEFTGHLRALAVFDDGMGPAPYVGGAFSSNGGRTMRNLAKWNGNEWVEVEGGVDGTVHALEPAVDQGVWTLLVGGSFSTVGAGVPAQNIARLIGCRCYADCTGEGSLDVFDFLCFQDAFVVADPYADCDENSVFDVFDFLCFQDAFVTGCQ